MKIGRGMLTLLRGRAAQSPMSHAEQHALAVDERAANALWAGRGEVAVDVQWKEGEPNGGRHSHSVPDVRIAFPDGRVITLLYELANWTDGRSGRAPVGTVAARVQTADGQKIVIAQARRLAAIHRALVVERLAVETGSMDIAFRMPEDPDGAIEEICIGIVASKPPTPCGETYSCQWRITSWSGDRPPDPPPFDRQSPWSRLLGEVLIRMVSQHSGNGKECHATLLSHPDLGVVVFAGDRVHGEIERARAASLENAFAAAPKQAGPVIPGNASATRLLALAVEALSLDPDLTDDTGARIDTLVTRHVPALMCAHARAARTASAEEAIAMDHELARGIEAVRKSVDEALARLTSMRRDDLCTQVRFLEARRGVGEP